MTEFFKRADPGIKTGSAIAALMSRLGLTGGYISRASKEYAIYVNSTRAIPKASDGLKDGMRKGLWVMRTHSGKTKTMGIAGEMIAQGIYVHGDGPAADNVSILAAPYANNVPLIKGHGNFGTRTSPKGWAAPRYTEVSKQPYTNDLVYADLDIVPMEPNYDGSKEQPVTFLPLLPLLLVNGMSGIGVGDNTTILPRDPKEVAAAVKAVIEGKKPKRLVPTYTWSGNRGTFIEYGDNGGPAWEFKGSVTVKDTSTLIVTELPPETEIEKFKERLNKLEEDGKIQNYEDETSAKIKIIVTLKRGTAKDWTEEDAIKFLGLTKRITENVVVINDVGTKLLRYKWDGKTDPIEKLLTDWVEWRFSWYVKRFERLRDLTLDEIAFLELVIACYDDKLPGRATSKTGKADLEDDIRGIATKKKIKASSDHVERISGFRTYKWTGEEMQKIRDALKQANTDLKLYKRLISKEGERRTVFTDDVTEAVKKVK